MKSRCVRLLLVALLFIAVGFAMDVANVHSTTARCLFLTLFFISIAMSQRNPRHVR